MQLASLDLNLLVALDALLQEGGVTRAAERLRLSQPALSASLAKLRRHFDDDLLRRVGNRYELSPLAVQLKERTAVALEGVHRVFAAQPVFDPGASEREFSVLCSDYAMAVIGAAVTGVLAERGLGARLKFQQHTPNMIDHAAEVLRTVDGLMLPHGFLEDLPYQDLYQDEWVCLLATDNSRVGDRLTMELLAELPWAFTYNSPAAFTAGGRQLQLLGIRPRIEIVVESFLALPYVIAGSDRIALVQSQLAARMTAAGDVRVLPCPYDVVGVHEAFWWHPSFERDPGHVWLRELLVEAGRRTGITGSDARPQPK